MVKVGRSRQTPDQLIRTFACPDHIAEETDMHLAIDHLILDVISDKRGFGLTRIMEEVD